MKPFICLLLLCSFGNLFSQTQTASYQFSGTDLLYVFETNYATAVNFPNNDNIVNDIVVSGVPSNYILRQVDYVAGDGVIGYSASLNTLKVVLRAPGSATDKILFSPYSSVTDQSYKTTTLKYRIHPYLKTADAQKGTDGTSLGSGFPYPGYHLPEESWENGTLNGTWKITSTFSATNSTTYPRKLKSVKLTFGPPYTYQTISFAGDSNCNQAAEIVPGKIYLSDNNNNEKNQGNYPALTNWNGARNKTAWFYFTAINTTGRLTVSGFSDKMQSILIASANDLPCNGTYTTPTIPINQASSPRRWNFEYNMSGLTIGKKYFLLVDGDGASGADGAVSPFYIEYEANRNTVLPIELLIFSATQNQQYVDLNWVTATERDNDYFTVFRSANLETWEVIGTIQGNGNSVVKNDYLYTDKNPLNGVSYYKLRQTDFNGQLEEFTPVSIHFNGVTKNNISVYPNPSKGVFEVVIQSATATQALLQISDVSGKIVYTADKTLQAGNNQLQLENCILTQGIYILKGVMDNKETVTVKLIVE